MVCLPTSQRRCCLVSTEEKTWSDTSGSTTWCENLAAQAEAVKRRSSPTPPKSLRRRRARAPIPRSPATRPRKPATLVQRPGAGRGARHEARGDEVAGEDGVGEVADRVLLHLAGGVKGA